MQIILKKSNNINIFGEVINSRCPIFWPNISSFPKIQQPIKFLQVWGHERSYFTLAAAQRYAVCFVCILSEISTIYTEELFLDNIKKSGRKTAKLDIQPTSLKIDEDSEATVNIDFQVAERIR